MEMFHSKKGPLRAVWVAAYFLKELKKAQVRGTDVSRSVDILLHSRLDVITYRVLAYLLLGVVRIHSKKVDYLLDECQEALTKITNFMMNGKYKGVMEVWRAPSFSISLPDSFALDAFDLEILEDSSGGNVVAWEDITLKDGAWRNEGIGQYCLDIVRSYDHDKYDHDKPVEHFAVGQASCSTAYTSAEDVYSGVLKVAMEINDFYEPGYSEANEGGIRSDKLLWSLHGSDIPQLESQIHGEANEENLEQFLSMDTDDLVEKESMASANLHGWKWDYNSQETKEPVEEEPPEVLVGRVGEDSCMDLDRFHGVEEEPPEAVNPVQEEDYTGVEQMELPYMASSVFEKDHTEDDPVLTTPEITARIMHSKTSEASVPQFEIIPSPETKKRARKSVGRKCLVDDMVVLSNSFIKQSIDDSSDLISKRAQVSRNVLSIWRVECMHSRSRCFVEPLISCCSSELRSLCSGKRLKILEPTGSVGPLEEVDIQESPVAARTPEQVEIAPETPVQKSTSQRIYKSPMTLEDYNSDRARPVESSESSKQEVSVNEDQELSRNVLNEVHMEIDAMDKDDQQSDGTLGQTNMAAIYLKHIFQKQRERREDETVRLLRVLDGRTKKESARFFYEILELKTKDEVDVKQDIPYGDIIIGCHGFLESDGPSATV